jgi:hypothetical protein
MNEELLRRTILEFLSGNHPQRVRFVGEAIFFYSKVTLQAREEVKERIAEQDLEDWIKCASDWVQVIESEMAKRN